MARGNEGFEEAAANERYNHMKEIYDNLWSKALQSEDALAVDVQRRHRASLTVFGRVGDSKIISIPANPSVCALAAFKKLRVDHAVVVGNAQIDRLLNENQWSRVRAPNPEFQGACLQIFDSFQAFVNAARDDFNRFAGYCYFRKEQVALSWPISWVQEIDPDIHELASNVEAPLREKLSIDLQQVSRSEIGEAVTKLPSQTPQAEDNIPPEGLDRPTRYLFSIMMLVVFLGALSVLAILFVRPLILLSKVDHKWHRLGWFAISPLILLCLFPPFEHCLQSLFKLYQTLFKLQENSTQWSGSVSSRLVAQEAGFSPPTITIVVPVYKEGLEGVIIPTISSILRAVGIYAAQGGNANILMCDDGLQLIDEELRSARLKYYSSKDLSWIARPRHMFQPTDESQPPLLRRGKFKLASNLNNALNTVMNRQLKYDELCRQVGAASLHQDFLSDMGHVCDQIASEWDWAGGQPSLGELIIIVDSDSRVPRYFLQKLAVEAFLNPQIDSFIYSAEPMLVLASPFEFWGAFDFMQANKDLTFYARAGASPTMFGRHEHSFANFPTYRMSALRDVQYLDEDGYDKIWSDSHVLNELELRLRLQSCGKSLRLVDLDRNLDFISFHKGVSLTIQDHMMFSEKAAYGIFELVFSSINYWWSTRGPFSRAFWKISRGISWPHRISLLSVVAWQLLIAASFPLALFNYFFTGWHQDPEYHEYRRYVFILFLTLPAMSLLSFMVDYICDLWLPSRGHSPKNPLASFFMHLASIIILLGLSLNSLKALISHLFHLDMNWGSSFFDVLPPWYEFARTLRKYKWRYLLMTAVSAVIITLALVNSSYQIRSPLAIVPLGISVLAHLIVPIGIHMMELRYMSP